MQENSPSARTASLREREEIFERAFRLCPFMMTIHSFPDMKLIDVNEAWERRTGIRREAALGRTVFELGFWANPQDLTRAVRKLEEEGRVVNFEAHFRSKAGKDLSGLVSSEVVDFHDGPRVLSIIEDISVRRRAEEASRVSETKFQRVFQEAGVGMIIGTANIHFIAANKEFCEMVGYSEEELFDKTVESIIHPDDRSLLIQGFREAVEGGRKFYRLEGRFVRKNRDVIWTENTASLIRHHDGTLQNFVGQVVDITARKRAEQAAASLSGRLIQAQEDERRHIARELHDDIGQRSALLIMNLEKVGREPNLDALRISLISGATDVATAVQNLSHRLHSSKLEYVGLVSAIESLREEVKSRGLELTFTHHDVPENLPWKVSICLYRILQEAMSNAVKYSGVREFEAELKGSPGEVSLTFHDSGVGFDVEKAKWKGGLGLISMEERVNLVGGTLSIVSGPTSGTLVSVRIPIAEEPLTAPASP